MKNKDTSICNIPVNCRVEHGTGICKIPHPDPNGCVCHGYYINRVVCPGLREEDCPRCPSDVQNKANANIPQSGGSGSVGSLASRPWPAAGILSSLGIKDHHQNNAENKANKAVMKNKADVHNDFRTMNNFEENINNNIHQEQHGPGGTQNAGINCGGRNRKNKAIFNDFRTINTHTKNVNNNVRQIQYGPGGTQNAGIGC